MNELTTETGEESITYSKSRVERDWVCPRSFFLEYKFDGKGIVPVTTPLEFYLGTCIHDGLAVIANRHPDADIDLIGETAKVQILEALKPQDGEIEDLTFAKEQASLVEGLLRGFYKHMWPKLMEQFPKIIAYEKKVKISHDGLEFIAVPDLLVEDKEGGIWYIEYKTTGSNRVEWINSWQTAIQLHSACKAAEASIGRPVKGVIVQGLYKGGQSYGKQNSPFCYCYKKEGNPPFFNETIQYEYKAGYKRFPIWELEGGVKKWVEEMPEDLLTNQFPQTPPIFINDRLVERFFKQQAMRQREIQLACEMLEGIDDGALGDSDARAAILDCAFEQHFTQCTPSWRRSGCPYKRICHGFVDDPLKEGFEYREVHYPIDIEVFEE